MTNITHHLIPRRVATTAAALVVAASAVALHASPASAITPSSHGSGWLSRTAGGAVSSWVSTGANATLADLGGGKWKVTFPGITAAWGVAAASVGNDIPGGTCAIDAVTATSAAASVAFHCV